MIVRQLACPTDCTGRTQNTTTANGKTYPLYRCMHRPLYQPVRGLAYHADGRVEEIR